MIVLGVDPGSLKTGVGIIDATQSSIVHLKHDVILLPKHYEIADRIKLIYDRLADLIQEYNPVKLSLETSFYGKNAQSALKLGQVRGAIMVLAKNLNLQLIEYSPREVKKIITGNGAASKEQVAFMIKSLLNLPQLPNPFDASDALGLAVCEALKSKYNSLNQGELNGVKLKKSRKQSSSWSHFLQYNTHKIISG